MLNGSTAALPHRPALVWLLLAALLLAWNGLAARYASPFHLIHASDGTQYHLLARNRLLGHYEVGDRAHTVRMEGLHPVWRPGLVWIEEALARVFGSVRAGAAVASVLGTTLLELLVIWLAVSCFGRAAGILSLLALLSPLPVGGCFLMMAVGQGPEPWSAAAIMAGLAVLVEAMRRQSWGLVIVAGALAGLADWFRTGNHLLFAVPCAVYGLSALKQRDLRGFCRPALAGAAFLAVLAVGGRQVPSAVDKTTVNLWHRMVEFYGDKVPHVEGLDITLHLGGLEIVEGTAEDYYDYIVPRSKHVSAARYFADHRGEIVPIYLHGLRDILTHGAAGLRALLGNAVFLCFIVQLLFSLAGRAAGAVDTLAFAGGALAHLLIPTALLRGDEPTHYLYVALPLFLIVAAAGLVQLWQLARAGLERWQPVWAERLAQARGFLVVLGLAPCACLSFVFYLGTLNLLRTDYFQARQEQAALDELSLSGKRVGCRNMSWFVDRNVETVFLPYADVAGLETYAHGQGLDGILVWDHERQPLFRASPYGPLARFEEQLQASRVFGPPVVRGAWHWYPLLRVKS
jgi:hypothetical protein